jgi:hypothetical protein
MAGALAAPLHGSAAPTMPPSKACRRGRYVGYARFESPGTPFASEDECVTYGLEGGTIVALIPGYAPSLDVKIGESGQPGWCTLYGSMRGFVPRSAYDVAYWGAAVSSGVPFPMWSPTHVTTDKYGRASWTLVIEDGNGTFNVQLQTVDGTVSGWRLIDC